VSVSAAASVAVLLSSLAFVLSAKAAGNPYFDPAKPHHTPDGFRNNYIEQVDKPLGDLLRWQWEAFRNHLPPPPREPVPTVVPDLAALQGNTIGAPSVTWLGHASTLVQSGGLNILTDPVFSERASPVQFSGPRRAQPPGIAPAQLPPIDVVLISHNHYDHLDRASVLLLSERSGGKTLFLVPLGLKPWFAQQGIDNAIELDWWDVHMHRGVEFRLVPVQHWSARSLGDRNRTLWGGWAVLAPDLHWYFSGDSGYSRDFADTRGRVGGLDLALLAIGAYEPRWFMQAQHMNPAEAVQAHKDLGARRSIGIHWGTFNLTDEALDQPPRELAQARQAQGIGEQDFFVLRIGETRKLEPRKAGQSPP
jgi:N-acyl-phosphatidylethanolamine-hydrolysing phospholipase D